MNKKIILSYLFSLILVIAIISIIDIKEVIKETAKLGLINFIFLGGLYSVAFVFRALRWKTILSPITEISLKDSFFITNMGFFVNALLPARTGEIARAYILSKKKKLGKIKSFSTVVLDRVIDGMTLFLFFVLSVFLIEIPKEFSSIILIPALLFAVVFLFFFKPDKFKVIGRLIVKVFPSFKEKITYVFNEMKEAGNIFYAEKHFLKIIIYSVLIWIIESLVFYFTAQVLGIELSLFHVFLLIVVTGFAVMIPSSPNYIGTFEAGVVVFFMAFNLNQNSAISLAVIVHLIQTIVVISLGIISMNKLGLSFKSISETNFSQIKEKIKGN